MKSRAAPVAAETVDFIVVGAGSGGSVAAEALSRDGRHQVAVIEAGGSDRRFFVQMPLGYGKTFYDRALNWNYRTEPDPGLGNRDDYWPRGRLVGGSGSLNAMVWIRGAAADFDDWEREGNPGWSAAAVRPVFEALEGRTTAPGTPAMSVSDVSARMSPLAGRFVAAGAALGFGQTADFNGERQDGMGIYRITTRGRWRCSAAKAFLRPALRRGNVRLHTRTMVTRLIVEGRRITGVEVEGPGGRRIIAARREVVLAAGAVNTPQLLQVSGIGPAAHLSGLGIPVHLDAPAVGRHLQDHLGINYYYRATVPTLNQVLRPLWSVALQGARFLFTGGGPLSLSLNQGGGFVRSRPDLERPDIQLYFQAITTTTARGGSRPLLRPDPFPGFAIGLSTCRPTARGEIMVRSPDASVAPAIRPNAYGTPEDVATMLAGVKLLRRIAAAAPMAEVIAEELAPGPGVVDDAALIADFRERSGTVYHACGTARMGPDPASAVVDHRLKAHGLTGLRIADASVFPAVPSGNTNAPAMMVAARAAAFALEDAAG